MTSILLFSGAANPNDITLRDAGIALDVVATIGAGTFAVALVAVGIEAATESGSGSDAVTLLKIGTLVAATAGAGNAAVIVVDSESLALSSAGQSVEAAATVQVGMLGAATAGESDVITSLDLVPAAPNAQGGGGLIAPSRHVGMIRPLIKRKPTPMRVPRRKSRIVALALTTAGGESQTDITLTNVGAISANSIDASQFGVDLTADPLLNDERIAAIALLTDLLAA